MEHICPKSDRILAILIPVLMLFSVFPISIMIWFIKKNECPLINSHGKEIINLLLTMIIVAILFFGCFFLMLRLSRLFGFAMIPFALIQLYYMISLVIAIVKAYQGKPHQYGLTIRIIK